MGLVFIVSKFSPFNDILRHESRTATVWEQEAGETIVVILKYLAHILGPVIKEREMTANLPAQQQQ